MRSLLLAFLLLVGSAEADGPPLSVDRLIGVWVQTKHEGHAAGPDRLCFVFRADSTFTMVVHEKRAKPSVSQLDGAFKIEADGIRLTDNSGEFSLLWPTRFENDTLVLELESEILNTTETLWLDRVIFPPVWCPTIGKMGG